MIGECFCYDDNYDMPSVFRRAIVVARKDHECCECHSPIKRGARYERIRGLWNGQWVGATTCLTCATIRQDLYPCGGPPLGELAYALSEDYGITLVGPLDDFAAREAAKHALRMNHVVHVEQTHLIEVRPRKSRKRETS